MTPRQRLALVQELARIQREIPDVNVKRKLFDDAIAEGQARVVEIEAMLASDSATTVPAGDLEP